MKGQLLFAFFALCGLTGCTVFEHDPMTTPSEVDVSQAHDKLKVAGARTMEEFKHFKTDMMDGVKQLKEDSVKNAAELSEQTKDLRTDIVNGVQQFKQDSVKGAAELSEQTEQGAAAVGRVAKSLEQLSQDTAKNAAAMREALKRFDDNVKNNPTESTTTRTETRQTATP